MRKENILKGIIILTGTGLTYIRYNFLLHLDFKYLGYLTLFLVLLFLMVIILLNKKVYNLKTFVINPKLVSMFSKFKIPKYKLPTSSSSGKQKSNKNYINTSNKSWTKKGRSLNLISWGVGAISLGTILGFYFKTLNNIALRNVYIMKSEWKAEAYIELLKSETSFFGLKGPKPRSIWQFNDFLNYGGFDFNWFALLIGILFTVLIYIIIKRTTFFTVLKTAIKPYLK